MRRRTFLLGAAGALRGQEVEFVCPMDPDVRGKVQGNCPRCGMKLEAGFPEPVEYPVRLRVAPRALKAGARAKLEFEVLDPKTGARVRRFNTVHEKLFHLFVISEDLEFFAHEHPMAGSDGLFRYEGVLPRRGAYRLLCDFYPEGGTPQMTGVSLLVEGDLGGARLVSETGPSRASNLTVSLMTEPEEVIAGKKTLLFFDLSPSEGLEPYLGAWGHLLAASEDLVDAIHTHPAFPEAGKRIQFNVLFPRAGMYRLWVQFQRAGLVNTARFTLPVRELG